MTLVEDTNPKPNWLIELKLYALHNYTGYEYEVDLSLSTLAEYRLVGNEISGAMPNSLIHGEAM
jgi:hypothetical protein